MIGGPHLIGITEMGNNMTGASHVWVFIFNGERGWVTEVEFVSLYPVK